MPARGGSKGIKRKNLALCGGKPLLWWTITEALKTKMLTACFVSSEDAEILDYAKRQLGAWVIERPLEFATDEATTESVVKHILDSKNLKEGMAVILQPTSPLRTAQHIDEAISMAMRYDSLASVTRFHGFLWRDVLEPDRARIQPVNHAETGRIRRQDRFPEYQENGAIYAFSIEGFRKWGCTRRVFGRFGLYEMPYLTKFEVDEPEDLELINLILEHRNGS